MNKTLLFDITSRCNLRCKHCYNSNYFSSEKNETMEKVDNVITFIHTNAINHVHILGGEPLLSEETWRLIDSCEQTSFSINTNGTLLDNCISSILSRPSINQITVSIDGHNEETNSRIRGGGVFDTVVRNTKSFSEAIKQYGAVAKINLAFVITPDNFKSISHLAEIALKTGADRIMLSFLYYEGSAKDNFRQDYNFEEITKETLHLLYQVKCTKIEVLIDAHPLFFELLNIQSSFHLDVAPSGQACYVNEGFCYISANHDLYPCGPSSKIGNTNYLLGNVDDNPTITFDLKCHAFASGLCGRCHERYRCELCPLGIACTSYDLCDYSMRTIQKIAEQTGPKKIQPREEYGFYAVPNHEGYQVFFVHYGKHYTEQLFKGKIPPETEDYYSLTINKLIERCQVSDEYNAAVCRFAALSNKCLIELL